MPSDMNAKFIRMTSYLSLAVGISILIFSFVVWKLEQIFPTGLLVFGLYAIFLGLGTILLIKRNPAYGNAFFYTGAASFILFLAIMAYTDFLFLCFELFIVGLLLFKAISSFNIKIKKKLQLLQLKLFRTKKADAILRNYWERYNVKKMRLMASVGIIILAIFIWIFPYVLLTSMYSFFAEAGLVSQESDIFLFMTTVITIIDIVIISIVVMIFRRKERKNKDWYASGLLDPRLDRLEVLDMIRSLLTKHKYLFTEVEKRSIGFKRWVTNFELSRDDFRLRLEFFEASYMRVAAIYIGPETILNKKQLQEFKSNLSQEFIKRYGSPISSRANRHDKQNEVGIGRWSIL